MLEEEYCINVYTYGLWMYQQNLKLQAITISIRENQEVSVKN